MGSEGCNPARARTKRSNNAHEASEPVCANAVYRLARGLDDDEDRVADAVGARAAVATTFVAPKRRRVD